MTRSATAAASRTWEEAEPVSVGYRRQAGPAPAGDIERLERRIGQPLPAPYRDYLRQHDGGRLEDNSQALNEIFGVGPDAPDWANMWKMLDTYRDRVPSWLLPVAQDAVGNLFALSLREKDSGSVWFWDHEREADEDDPPTEDNLRWAAANWAAFLDSLGPPPEIDDDDLIEVD
jgi:cell wall assembly regulator SMI1